MLLREKKAFKGVHYLVITRKRSCKYEENISLLRVYYLVITRKDRVIINYLVITRKRSCYYEKSVCYNKIHGRYYLNFYSEKNAYIRTF